MFEKLIMFFVFTITVLAMVLYYLHVSSLKDAVLVESSQVAGVTIPALGFPVETGRHFS